MATNKKRKNAGKGVGARERKRRRAQFNQQQRERLRGEYPRDDMFAAALTLGIVGKNFK